MRSVPIDPYLEVAPGANIFKWVSHKCIGAPWRCFRGICFTFASLIPDKVSAGARRHDCVVPMD
jgi:hypothetical protein